MACSQLDFRGDHVCRSYRPSGLRNSTGLLRLKQSSRNQSRNCLGSGHGMKFSASTVDVKSGCCLRDFQDHADFPIGFSVRDPPHALELTLAQGRLLFIWCEDVVQSVAVLMGENCRHIEPSAALGTEIDVTFSGTHTDVRKISLRAMHRDGESDGLNRIHAPGPKILFRRTATPALRLSRPR